MKKGGIISSSDTLTPLLGSIVFLLLWLPQIRISIHIDIITKNYVRTKKFYKCVCMFLEMFAESSFC